MNDITGMERSLNGMIRSLSSFAAYVPTMDYQFAEDVGPAIWETDFNLTNLTTGQHVQWDRSPLRVFPQQK